MQPEFTSHREIYYDYPVSPKKFIRFGRTKGFDYIYSDCFDFNVLRILTEEEVDGEIFTKIEYKVRIDMYNPPIFFVANIIKTEGMAKALRANDIPLK